MTITIYDLAGAEADRRFSPFCRRSKMALAHKGLAVETVPWRFTEKDRLPQPNAGRVPVIVDGERVVHDSTAIADYLEERYPDRPSLFGGASGRALTRFVQNWTETVLQTGLIRLVVWKLDRLARSMKQLIETIETLRVRGIGFRSLTEALDTTTAQGRLVFHMFGALAEFERSLIRERTQAGLAAARRLGHTGGRPPKLTDDDLDVARALLANPDIGVTQIAHRLGVSPATLYRYIPAARTANLPDV